MSAHPRPYRLAMPPAARVRRRSATPRVHGANCPCCRQAAGPADTSGAAPQWPAWWLAGMGIGCAIVEAHAWITGTPGLALMFGTWS